MNQFPSDKERFLLPTPTAYLELLTTAPKDEDLIGRVVIIAHPHPLQGGTMDNKVVTTLARTFNDMGLRAVRFNFRGVGESEGDYDDGIGETDDLVAVFHWVQKTCPGFEIWLAGFSFGAYVSYRAATISPCKDVVTQLISIAPPVQYPGFHELPAPKMPWLIVQGEDDEVVDANAVFEWAAEFEEPPQVIRMLETSHFFHGKLIELKNVLKEVLR